MQSEINIYKQFQFLAYTLSLLIFCLGYPAYGQAVSLEPMEVVKKFKRDLYVTAERTGGSDKEWTLLEEEATKAMHSAFDTIGQNTEAFDSNGRSALHLAASNGYLFLIDVILNRDFSKNWINAKDKDGLTAYEHALLALPETLMACHPKIENPFVLVPFVVNLPYYVNRKPFPEIAHSLVQSGADKNTENARNWWLGNCSNQDANDRSEVENSKELYTSLTEISLTKNREKKRRDIDETVEFLKELMELMPSKTRPTPEELQEEINKMYRKEGLSPPD